MDPILVMSCDPGVTSGYTYAELSPGEYCHYYPFQEMDDVSEFWDRLATFGPRYLIMEDFEFRRKSRTGLNLFPVQLIGVAHLYEYRAKQQFALVLQKAAQGKSFYTDTQLKKFDLYKAGIPHGMDASRHLLQWLTFGAGYQFNGSKRTGEFFQMLNSWEG
jgi:hypothetical protein